MNGNNLPPAMAVQFAGHLDALLDAFEEGAWPKASADDQPANSVGDVNDPLNIFDVRGFLQQDRGIQVSFPKHDSPSLPIRQAKVGLAVLSQSLTPADARQTWRNEEWFHPVPQRDGRA